MKGFDPEDMASSSEAETLRELAAQKEKEWRQVEELRSQSLEASLHHCQRELAEERAKFLKLKEDFKYNLKLLADRDAELEQYDISSTGLKNQLAGKDAEISDLKIKIDEMKSTMKRDADNRSEMQRHYQSRVHEKQLNLEEYRSAKDAEVNQIRAEYERCQRNLELRVRELEEEMDAQKNELTAGFDDAMRKRENEYRKELDEMSCTVLSHELKVKLLQKELNQVKSLQQAAITDSEEAESNQRALANQLKHREWELQDLAAMKDAEISELKSHLQQLELKINRMQEDFSHKHAELSKQLEDKEQLLLNTREGAKEREEQLNAEILRLTSQLEDKDIQLRDMKWKKDDAEREMNSRLQRLTDELQDVTHRWEKEMSDKSQSQLAKEHELIMLKEAEKKLKHELGLRKRDIDRYKRELQSALEREASTERSRTQLDLDWQRRFEDVERQQYQKSEDFIKTLAKARDEALAEVKQKDRELEHHRDMAQLLLTERDEALATIKKHGLVMDREFTMSIPKDIPKSVADQLMELQQQNESLRKVIRQMREEIENIEAADGKPRSLSVAEEYVRNIEDELKSLKTKYRQLEQERDSLREHGEVAEMNKEVKDVINGNNLVKVHVERLNHQIGTLRKEKVQMTTLMRKLQTRVQHLEKMVDHLSQEPRQKQVEIEQLQYEMGAQSRHHQVEVAALKQRMAESELQVAEARKEAEEYHRASLQSQAEVTALQNELSQLKIDLAEARPAVNFGAQELFIQQLQDEIQNLRLQIKGEDPMISDQPISSHLEGDQGWVIVQLQRKLKQAAKRISQLAKEKQQLIEVGNRLRAALNKNGIRPPSPPTRPIKLHHGNKSIEQPFNGMNFEGQRSRSDIQQSMSSQLQRLEQLQYELTRHELALSHQKSARSHLALTNLSGSSEEDGEDFKPQSILKKKKNVPSGQEFKLSPVMEDGSKLSGRLVHQVPITAIKDPQMSPHRRSSSPLRKSADGGVGISLSSVGGESLQEIWKMLDDESRPMTPAENSGPFAGLQFPGDTEQASKEKDVREMVVEGQRPIMEAKMKPSSAKLSPRSAGRVICSAIQKKQQQIRNYNLRDSNEEPKR